MEHSSICDDDLNAYQEGYGLKDNKYVSCGTNCISCYIYGDPYCIVCDSGYVDVFNTFATKCVPFPNCHVTCALC